MSLTLSVLRIFSSFCQAVRCDVAAVGEPVGSPTQYAARGQANYNR